MLAWNSAPVGTLPGLELYLDWNFAPPETMAAWNSALHGTLPWLELCLAWNFTPDGIMEMLEFLFCKFLLGFWLIYLVH